ncbi:MAG: cell wall-binding repeat-containing protein [Erysipelotrichaceae bacterium]|nr:cell wall-binding repeat-containing protein [Erysipelotrichaceae bacterium]
MKKLITLFISILMIFTLLPGKPVEADGTVVTNIPITYDETMTRGSTKLSENQMILGIMECIEDHYPGEGVLIPEDGVYLVTKVSGRYNYVSGSNYTKLDKSKEYYFCVEVHLNPGYAYPQSGLPTVTLNGKPADDVDLYENVIYAYKKITVTDDDVILSVDLDPKQKKIQKGTDFQFHEYVNGTDLGASWSLSGKNSSGTKVENGKVTIAADESATTIRVTATSTLDPSKSATSTIYVTEEKLTIDSITVEPAEVSLSPGMEQKFEANVVGNDDHDVAWKLYDKNGYPQSGATYVNDYGLVVISEWEDETQLILRAMSAYHPGVYGEAVINIIPPQPVESVAVVYDASKVPLNTNVSGKDVYNALQTAIREDAGERAYVDAVWSGFSYRDGSKWVAVEDDDTKLDPSREYYIRFNIEEKAGYCFNTDNLPKVTVNGEPADYVEWFDQAEYGSVDAYKKVTLSSGGDPTPVTGEVVRLAGKDRYNTALSVGNELLEQMKKQNGAMYFDAIVLATGENFADALAGGYLAAKKGAPIVLTKPKVAQQIVNWINVRLRSGGMIYVLGGTGAVPEECLAGLDPSFKIERLTGKNRYETNLKILNAAGVTNEDILICTGENYADSLSASSTGRPMLLVNTKKNVLNEDQKAFLTAHSSNNFYIIGGTGAVSEDIEVQVAQIKAPKRLSGKGRYQTSVAIAEEFFDHPEYAVLAFAQNYPDGLSGGPLAYVLNAPILLTKGGSEGAARDYCSAQGVLNGFICGGTGVISDETAHIIFPGSGTIPVR